MAQYYTPYGGYVTMTNSFMGSGPLGNGPVGDGSADRHMRIALQGQRQRVLVQQQQALQLQRVLQQQDAQRRRLGLCTQYGQYNTINHIVLMRY